MTRFTARPRPARSALAALSILALLASPAAAGMDERPDLSEAGEVPKPLPRDCGGTTPPAACCVHGYVYYHGAPVAGASVTLSSISGTVSLITAVGSLSGHPTYAAILSEPPLASPGDMITLTASYNGMTSVRAWRVQSRGQHVDIGLVGGDQALGPLADTRRGPATNTGGLIEVDTTWSLAHSPYVVTRTVVISGGIVLTVEPGVEVRFDPFQALQVDGTLAARGTAGSPITFTTNTEASRGTWQGILFADSSVDAAFDAEGAYAGGSILQHVVVEYGGDSGVPDNGAVRLDRAAPYLDHITVRESGSAGVRVSGAPSLILTRSVIRDNAGPGVRMQNATGDIVQNTVAANGGAGIITDLGTSLIASNTVTGNHGSGIRAWNGRVTIQDNTVAGNTGAYDGGGISGGEYPYSLDNIIGNLVEGNTATHAGGGIHGGIHVHHNVVRGNAAPLGGGIANGTDPSQQQSVRFNVVQGNQATVAGGGIYAPDYANVADNLILSNTAPSAGGALCGLGIVARNVFAENTSGAGPSALQTAGSSVNDNAFIRNASAGGGTLRSLGDALFSRNTFAGNTIAAGQAAAYVEGYPGFASNNLHHAVSCTLATGNPTGTPDLNAANNWWGAASAAEIDRLIRDGRDDPALGLVAYDPFLPAPSTDAPIAPPAQVTLTVGAVTATLSWSPSPESDAAGYKVYWDIDSGYPYSHSVNVYGARSYTFNNLPRGNFYYATVLAYDSAVGGPTNWSDGHFSWFAPEMAIDRWAKPQPNFTADPTAGATPLTVAFLDKTWGTIITRTWNFGDGATSMARNPSHVYLNAGIYTVTLTVSGTGGMNAVVKPGLITVAPGRLRAGFSAAPLSGGAPLTVTFIDQTVGDAVSWTWEFGDGGTSGARHAGHRYEAIGRYAVTQTVAGPGGSDREIKEDYIAVATGGPPVAEIVSITPAAATQGHGLVYFTGAGHDSDEAGASIVAREWRSSLDGWLSDQQSFARDAAMLSPGAHTISFLVRDDEGQWSAPATRALTVQASGGITDAKTLILVHNSKLAELYGALAAGQVLSRLGQLAAAENVAGIVVRLDLIPEVATAYAARDADYSDRAKANAVAQAIRQVVLARWAAQPGLEHLVIVGDDRALPFYRLVDGTDYRDEWTLTDDYYLDRQPTPCATCANSELYIPDLSGGRLIETPDQIAGQIDAFLLNGGFSLRSAAVAGADFVQDGAQAHCDALRGDQLVSDCELINDGWSRDDFVERVLGRRHDAVSINAHADAFGFSAPAGGVITPGDIVNATGDYARSIFFSVGCHAGLSVPDKPDLAEAFAARQAGYVANTGFGLGGEHGVGWSEELMLLFAEQLGSGSHTTPGRALALAKQEYYLRRASFEPADEKITSQSVLYGLPIVAVDSPPAARSAPAGALSFGGTLQLADGLSVDSLFSAWPLQKGVTTTAWAYYPLNAAVTGNAGQPVLPRQTYDVTRDGRRLHGAVLTGASYAVVSAPPPLQRVFTSGAALGDLSPAAIFTSAGWYPPLFFTPHHMAYDSGDRDAVVATAGQVNPNLTAGRQRVYTGMSFDLYYHDASADWTPPAITDVAGWLGASALVTVSASDASGIQAVVVAHTDGEAAWHSSAAVFKDGAWVAEFPAAPGEEFFAQAVDRAGNVAADDNGGRYYRLPAWVRLPVVVR